MKQNDFSKYEMVLL